MSAGVLRLSGETVLVTGASGFLGSHLCPALLASGAQVRALVRSKPAGTTRAEASTVIVAELGDTRAVREALRDVGLVVHLAGRAHLQSEASDAAQQDLLVANTDGTAALMRAVVGSGVRRFVQVSSVAAVSAGGDAVISEHTPECPVTAYGRSKLKADEIVRERCAEAGMEYAILRPPMIYGPRMKGNPLQLFRLVHRGVPLPVAGVRNERTVLYVGNFVEAVIALLSTPRLQNGAYLAGDKEHVSTPELIRIVAGALQVTPRLVPFSEVLLRSIARVGDALSGRTLLPTTRQVEQLLGSLIIDASHLAGVTGLRQRFSLVDGVRATADWYVAGAR